MANFSLIAEWTEGTAGAFLGDTQFPPVSEIVPRLWMGGCLENSRLPDEYGFVLSLYPWGRYELGPNTDRLQVRLYDGPNVPKLELIDSLARIVNWKRNEEEQTVLVHCQAGLNRSSLITTRALMLDGMTAADAIDLIRRQRSRYCLCNPEFERFLRSLP